MLAAPMRLVCLLLLASAVLGQDAPPEKKQHDAIGFPVTFNNEIITRRDVLRKIGTPAVDPMTLESQLKAILRDKLIERLAEIWGIRIGEETVREFLGREIDAAGGEAKFYLKLAQRGDTLARYKEDMRLSILKLHINYMMQNGITPGGRWLPWDLQPTPEEVRRAFRRDMRRKTAGPRVRAIQLPIRLTKADRDAVVQEFLREGHDAAWMKKELQRKTEELIAQVLAELDREKDFEKVAKARGVQVDEIKDAWYALSKEPTGDDEDKFLRDGKPGTWSEPIRQAEGDAKILFLYERERPGDRSLRDREVYVHYRDLIKAARSEKIQAMMELEALNRSVVRPRRVLKTIREDLLAELKDAEDRLNEMGLP